jgi:hypothetical protein
VLSDDEWSVLSAHWKAVATMAAIWIVAGMVIFFLRAARPTPDSVARFIESEPLANVATNKRLEVIDQVANQINRLDFEQRQELRKTLGDRRFFESLTEEEQIYFLERTLPEGFRQLMLALNKMTPGRREKIVKRAMEDLERDSPEVAERIGDERARKFLSEGLESFYEDASAEVKLDFAPVIERLQRETQNLR